MNQGSETGIGWQPGVENTRLTYAEQLTKNKDPCRGYVSFDREKGDIVGSKGLWEKPAWAEEDINQIPYVPYRNFVADKARGSLTRVSNLSREKQATFQVLGGNANSQEEALMLAQIAEVPSLNPIVCH